ncbi:MULTISPECIES: ShlB/FhaC/HecB family hemolysin secretion/activation protein [Halomonas]|uniref:ShlB/FhaC/HecB family hemolysin secretion/activation protein n=1 Tax=Halomonas TaxID=2745 RepID=UPI001A8EB036|nr:MULTISPECIES: ShlB/FhaC/HecB family hemolysin secretion/activation protein [Halomonas]MBN8414207.1 ShlB/FhaC/HecB family hemolysin secretion/activation protein [Halomonas litopenaei]MBY5970353.1 ShlB/FhaC/HecB family hemolysin secretion/activation protein [Halomonas denitrificans]
MRRTFSPLAATGCLLLASAAMAQETLDTVDDIIENQRLLPPERDVQTEVDLPDDANPGVPDSVTVRHVRFIGDSVLDLSALSSGLQAMVGQTVSREAVEAEVKTITDAYQSSGYPLSFAYLPTNNFIDGNVRIVLVEGHIARTEIVVDDDPVARRVERLVMPLLDERPLTRATFERVSGLIEQIPGASLTLKAPVPRTPNGATTLRVEERRIDHFDYAGSVSGGDEEDAVFINRVSTQSLTSWGESLGFSWLWPIDNDNELYALDFHTGIGSDGLTLSASADTYRGSDDEDLIYLLNGQRFDLSQDQDTDRERYRLGLSYPVLLTRSSSLTLGGALRHHDETKTTTLRFEDRTLNQLVDDYEYSAADLDLSYRTQANRSLWQASAAVRQGVDLGGNEQRSRLNGTPLETTSDLHFTRWQLETQYRHLLGERWRLTAAANGFYSDDELPEPERGNYGGQRFGRGYDAGQAEGDYGYAGSLELRYLHTLDSDWLSNVEPFLVVDGARTEFQNRDVDSHLASAAAGVRLAKGRWYGLTLEYAEPIGDRDPDTDSRDGRINARLVWNFEG